MARRQKKSSVGLLQCAALFETGAVKPAAAHVHHLVRPIKAAQPAGFESGDALGEMDFRAPSKGVQEIIVAAFVVDQEYVQRRRPE
ncbi:MAG: hypothetical protein ACFE0P_06080 [Oceanicaulis sp.]